MTAPYYTADRKWIRQAFLLPKNSVDDIDRNYREKSTGMGKFSDTTLGGNQAINPPPQFTEYADIPEERAFEVSHGMGRCYSRYIDDNSVLLHIRAGLPAYNSLTSFFGNFYNPESSYMARTGRTNRLFFWLGEVAGMIFNLRLMPFILVGQLSKFLIAKPSTKFYYLKPAMPLFWNALTNMVNSYASQRGMVTGFVPDPNVKEQKVEMTEEIVAERNKMLPDIWRSDSYNIIDVYAVGTRYQRMANRQYEMLIEFRDSMGGAFGADNKETESSLANSVGLDKLKGWISDTQQKTISDYLQAYFNQEIAKTNNDVLEKEKSLNEPSPTTTEGDGTDKELENKASIFASLAEGIEGLFTAKPGEEASWSDFFKAEFRDGAQFITFRVDNPGDRNESFNNTYRDSELKSSIDSISQGFRTYRQTMANGNIGDHWVINGIESIVGAVTSMAQGALKSFGFGGLAALTGNALVDIPKYWDGSTANLPRQSYSMTLHCPYNTEVCRIQTLVIPTFALLALGLPLSGGPQAYGAPFLLESYCQGRAQSRLCGLDTIDIAASDFTRNGEPMTITINFSIVDMSSVMHMPITSSFGPVGDILSTGISKWLTTDDTVFSDYMAIWSSAGLASQIYPYQKLKRNFYKTMADFSSWFTPSHFANYVGGWDVSRMISGMWNATSRGG